MKKYIYGLFAIALILVSCTDKEDIDIAYKSQLTVSASHIFDSFTPVISHDDFSLNKEGQGVWNINLHTFIYDEQGNLVQKAEKTDSSLSSNLTCDLMLTPGEYTIISIAEFSGTYSDQSYKFWNISNENSLRDLKIEESDKLVTSPFETLGVNTQKITVDDKVCSITIDIKPVTGLLEVIIWDDDFTGMGENGFSFYAPYIQDLSIYASQLKQIVKFDGITPFYEYNTQTTRYMVQTHSPLMQVNKGGAKQVLGYRAFLPTENRDFFWELNCVKGCGQYLFTDGKDFQTSDKTTPVTIESGKQYVMDLVLDATYLFVQDYDPSKDMFERINEHLASYNKNLIKANLSERYDKYVGMNKNTIETYLGKDPYFTGESNNTVTYWGDGLISLITVRFKDASMQKANRIMLTWAISTQEQYDAVTDCLGELYTPLENGTTENVKQFINASTLQESTVGISWDIHNKGWYYDAIK